jgi:nifR3 family TIM-barrel protein
MNIPFYLAPMAELTHRAFRELIEDFGGCDEYFSEMISAGALLANGPFEKFYIDNNPKPEKVVFQIVGSDSGQISNAAALLDRLECAGIDINMGCSAPLIRKTGAGAAWMADIDRAGKLTSQVRLVVNRRLSVKLRTGFQDDFEYLVRFCRRLENEGVELITLHPRLVTEKFKRSARWEYISALKKELKIPVAGNGDIKNAQELNQKASTGGCDAIMIGRAAVRQPWIFARARALYMQDNSIPSKGDLSPQNGFIPNLEETGLRFLELLALHQPPEFFISRAKRFFSFFCDNLKWGNYLKNLLNREETLSGIEKVWKEYFRENGE